MTNKTITIDRTEILDLINCAETYGFANSVLFSAFSEWLDSVSDKEIQDYARTVAAELGYGEEDYDCIVEQLTDWRARYGAKS